MICLKYTSLEEIRLMTLYEHEESEKRGHALGNEGYLEWIKKFADIFRDWSNELSENCVDCGLNCQRDSTQCIDPYNSHRVHYLPKDSTNRLY